MHKFPVFRTVASQFVALLVTAGVAFLVLDGIGARSVLAGGLVSFVPSTLFILKFFRYSGARAAERLVSNAYVAEMTKLVLMGLGFALAFRLLEQPRPLMVFARFVVVHMANLAVVAREAMRRMSI